MWDGLDVPIREVIEADHNHFSVLEALKDAESPLTRAFIGDTGQSE
jgi:hypothetical protein